MCQTLPVFSVSEEEFVNEWLHNRCFAPVETRKRLMWEYKVGERGWVKNVRVGYAGR